jgi:hypothetical protein
MLFLSYKMASLVQTTLPERPERGRRCCVVIYLGIQFEIL